MGMRLRVFLNAEEVRTLRELRQSTTVPQRVKDRADVLRMNARGDYIETIASYFDWHIETVRSVLKRWQKHGLGGLWDAPKPGVKRRWQPRRHGLHRIAIGRGTDLQQRSTRPKASRRTRRDTEPCPPATSAQKKGIRWKRTRHSHRQKQDPHQRAIKQADLDMLAMAAAAGAD
jgi:hypothetical protein